MSLVVPPGEVRALIGPNGAGKTTFINMLTGQLRPDLAGTMALAESHAAVSGRVMMAA